MLSRDMSHTTEVYSRVYQDFDIFKENVEFLYQWLGETVSETEYQPFVQTLQD